MLNAAKLSFSKSGAQPEYTTVRTTFIVPTFITNAQ